MRMLSRPVDQMQAHYSAVVVGSGYGGAIVAARIARAGRDVCILERGKELHPGEYPNSALSAAREIQVHTAKADHGSAGRAVRLPRRARHHRAGGLRAGRHLADQRERGPRAERRDLRRRALAGAAAAPPRGPAAVHAGGQGDARVQPVPAVLAGPAQAAGPGAGGGRPGPPGDPPRHQRDVHQRPERGRGGAERVHAVRRLLLRLQLRRQEHGPDELPARRARARRAHLHRGGRAVRAALPGHLAGRLRRARRRARALRRAPRFVTADVVVLAAGTLGSTQILLRSRDLGLPVSDRLGHGFSGNGDVLAFAYDTDGPVRGVGLGGRVPRADTAVGPDDHRADRPALPGRGPEQGADHRGRRDPGRARLADPARDERRRRRGATRSRWPGGCGSSPRSRWAPTAARSTAP